MEWRPRAPRLALLRIVTGGLTFVGWFGAIAQLSGRVTQPVLLLDALLLAYVRGERRPYERRTLALLAGALLLFAAEAVREPGTVLSAPRGICFLLLALGSRAATYKVWERAQGEDEHLVWLIAPALVGAVLAGTGMAAVTRTPIAWLSWTAVGGNAGGCRRGTGRILLHEPRYEGAGRVLYARGGAVAGSAAVAGAPVDLAGNRGCHRGRAGSAGGRGLGVGLCSSPARSAACGIAALAMRRKCICDQKKAAGGQLLRPFTACCISWPGTAQSARGCG